MKIYRSLYPQLRQDGSGKLTRYTFLGPRRLHIGGWRLGFGFGFIEWGTNTSGIWLPGEDELQRYVDPPPKRKNLPEDPIRKLPGSLLGPRKNDKKKEDRT